MKWIFQLHATNPTAQAIAILAFVWLTPPSWLGDPMAPDGQGLVEYVMNLARTP